MNKFEFCKCSALMTKSPDFMRNIFTTRQSKSKKKLSFSRKPFQFLDGERFGVIISVLHRCLCRRTPNPDPSTRTAKHLLLWRSADDQDWWLPAPGCSLNSLSNKGVTWDCLNDFLSFLISFLWTVKSSEVAFGWHSDPLPWNDFYCSRLKVHDCVKLLKKSSFRSSLDLQSHSVVSSGPQKISINYEV